MTKIKYYSYDKGPDVEVELSGWNSICAQSLQEGLHQQMKSQEIGKGFKMPGGAQSILL
jgi:hypothetical protein